MLKNLLIAAAACAALTLAGCGSNPDGKPSFLPLVKPTIDTATAGKVQTIAGDIVAGVKQACGFVLDIAPAIDIAASLVGVGATASVITGICRSVNALGARRGTHVPTYRGVRLTGHRV